MGGDVRTGGGRGIPAAGNRENLTAGAGKGHVSFHLNGDPDRGWPASSNIRLRPDHGRGGGPPLDTWQITLPAARVAQAVHLYLPPMKWQVSVDAPRHLAAERRGVEVKEDDIDLGTLTLTAGPAVRIRAIDPEGAPVAGAVLRDTISTEALAVSDPSGWIEWEPERGELPGELLLEATGYAVKSIDVRERTSDLILDPLIVDQGGTLRIVVDRPATDEPIEVELIRNQRRQNPDGSSGTVVATTTIEPDQNEVEIDLIGDGRYSLHLDGAGPLEHWAEHVEISAGETEIVEVPIESFELEVKVTVDDQPLPWAILEIGTPTAPGPQWKGKVETDEEGIARAVAWQRSINVAVVQSEQQDIHTLEFFKLDGTGDESILIAIRNMKLTGTLVDGDTGKPMPSLPIHTRWEGTESAGAFSMRTDEDGRFESRSLKPGTYTVAISLPEYLPLEQTVELSDAMPVHNFELVLERGDLLYVQVVNDAGQPMPNATIMELNDDPSAMTVAAPHVWQAGPDGRASIPMGPDSRAVWFAAPDGTFGHAILDGSTNTTESSPHRLVMPVPAGAITVAAIDGEGQPVSSVWLALQHEGVPLPGRLVDLLGRMRSVSFRTGIDGTVTMPNMPKGQYEWWTWKIDSDHVSFDVPTRDPRPPDHAHYFSGGHERIEITIRSSE